MYTCNSNKEVHRKEFPQKTISCLEAHKASVRVQAGINQTNAGECDLE